LGLGEIVEPVLAQQLIESSIKRVTRGGWQIRGRDPHCRLPNTCAFSIDMAEV